MPRYYSIVSDDVEAAKMEQLSRSRKAMLKPKEKRGCVGGCSPPPRKAYIPVRPEVAVSHCLKIDEFLESD